MAYGPVDGAVYAGGFGFPVSAIVSLIASLMVVQARNDRFKRRCAGSFGAGPAERNLHECFGTRSSIGSSHDRVSTTTTNRTVLMVIPDLSTASVRECKARWCGSSLWRLHS